ncbi:hypothetical protein [Candidatus Methylacidithermus pantelleriae]|nr:hypothetical protein [Candidatus Methylacidithermus pantelleriae]
MKRHFHLSCQVAPFRNAANNVLNKGDGATTFLFPHPRDPVAFGRGALGLGLETLAGKVIVNLETLFPTLLPKAVAWAERVAADAAAKGRPLSECELQIASMVGVRCPERIRLCVLPQLPVPEDPQLAEAAQQLGLPHPNMRGLTLGYSILVREGHLSTRLLSHECRHVYQYEQAGGIASFLPQYLQSVLRDGYYNSSFEKDARAHEMENACPQLQ